MDSRISAVMTLIDGNTTPVSMISNQMAAAMDNVRNGTLDLLMEFSPVYDPKLGVSTITDDEATWMMMGIGRDVFNQPDQAAEARLLISMADLYKSLKTSHPDTEIAYYISAGEFLFSVPVFPPVPASVLQQPYSRQYWLDSLPFANPEGCFIVTEPYEDLSGKGIIITMARPVRIGDEFFGVVCMDISMDVLSGGLKLGTSLGKSSLLNENSRIVASADSVEPGSLFIYEADREARYGVYRRSGSHYFYQETLLEGQLDFAHRVAVADVYKKAIVRSLPFLLVLVFLNVLVALLVRIRREYLRATGERDFSRRLLSIVGHDLQTPLSVSRQAADMLNADNKDAVELVRTSVNSALALLKDLTYWGKTRHGEVRFKLLPCSISDLFNRVCDTVRPTADVKDINLKILTDVEIVLADSDALTTVIRNLVTNAIKYSRPSSTVRLEAVEGPGGYALVSVADDGDGMTPAQVERILQRKTLISHPGTRGEKGSGIGLSLITGLCDRAGWPISVKSELDKGTTFTVSVALE